MQVIGGVPDPQPDQRVAATQVVIEEGQRRAHGETVQPQRDLGQLDGQGVLIDSVDAALEHHAADDGLVGELGLVHAPSLLLWPVEGFLCESLPHVSPAVKHSRRRATHWHSRNVLDQFGDVVGQEVHGGDQKMAASHGRVQDLQIQDRLGRVELEQF